MTHMKTTIRIPSGFRKHVQLERLVRDEISRLDELRKLESEYPGRSRKKGEMTPRFIENIGAVGIYSMLQAEDLYNKSDEYFSEDRTRYARSLLVEICKDGNRRNLAGPPSDESLMELRRDYPNFIEAIEQIEYASALSRLADGSWFQMRPILLLGKAGLGKTAFAQAFAEAVGVPFRRLDVGTMSTASSIAGLSLSWSTGHAGEMLRLITSAPVANPIVMLDEVDKMHGHDMSPIEPTILAMLEQESARNFRDEGLLLRINLSHVVWLATANDLNAMSEPLRSRFTIVTVHAPSQEQAPAIIRSIYRKVLANNPWGHKFSSDIHDNVIDKLADYSPREISHLLPVACGKAAKRGERQIQPIDIPGRARNDKVRIGFM